MLGEYKVNRCTRQCHALERPLREGEWYYSVVLESGDEYIRRDYSAESWQGAPEGSIGWWKSRMPTSDEKKMVLAPPEVLVDLLRQMEQFPGKAKSRYLLALMLMRRKIVRPVTPNQSVTHGDQVTHGEEVKPSDEVTGPVKHSDEVTDPVKHSDEVTDPVKHSDEVMVSDELHDGLGVLRVEVVVDGSTIDVPICEIKRGESDSLRDELNELLYCEAEPEPDTDSSS